MGFVACCLEKHPGQTCATQLPASLAKLQCLQLGTYLTVMVTLSDMCYTCGRPPLAPAPWFPGVLRIPPSETTSEPLWCPMCPHPASPHPGHTAVRGGCAHGVPPWEGLGGRRSQGLLGHRLDPGKSSQGLRFRVCTCFPAHVVGDGRGEALRKPRSGGRGPGLGHEVFALLSGRLERGSLSHVLEIPP